MIKRPSSRVALFLRGGECLVDCLPVNGDVCEVQNFDTSLVIEGFPILMTPNYPIDVIVIVDKSPKAMNIMSVLKGLSGDIEKYSMSYDGGIKGIFHLRRTEVRHPIFPQNWRIQYSLMKHRVFVRADKERGIVSGIY